MMHYLSDILEKKQLYCLKKIALEIFYFDWGCGLWVDLIWDGKNIQNIGMIAMMLCYTVSTFPIHINFLGFFSTSKGLHFILLWAIFARKISSHCLKWIVYVYNNFTETCG